MIEMMTMRLMTIWFGLRYGLAMAAMVLFLILGIVGFFTSPFPLNVVLLIPYCFLADVAWDRHKKARRAYWIKHTDMKHASGLRENRREAMNDVSRAMFAKFMREYREQEHGKAA